MTIATREVQMKITMDYFDGYTKNIIIYEVYTGKMKTPVFRYKQVELKYPDGTIDEDRSYVCKLLIDEKDDFGTEYTNLDVEMLTTIYYNDGFEKIILVFKTDRKPDAIIFKFRYPNGKINRDEIKQYFRFDDEGKSVAEQLINYRNLL